MNNISKAINSLEDAHLGLKSILPNFICVKTRLISPLDNNTNDIKTENAPQLYQNEILLTKKMSKKRLHDFCAGRFAAKYALSELKIDNFPLLINSNRSPLWPDTIIGSISHSKNICIVAVGKKKNLKALGIDIETTETLNSDILPLICDFSEISHLEELQENSFGAILDNAKLIFSIKESLFKCLNPLIGCWIDFKEMVVTLDPENKTYTAKANSNNCDLSELGIISGKWYSNDYFHITCCWL